jgi:Flp pilus assembly protein TadD
MMRIVVVGAITAALLLGQTPTPDQLFADALHAQERGDFALAARYYQQAVKTQPDLFGAWANLGVVLVRLGRFDEAVEAYRSALKLDQGNVPLRMNLALAFYKKGDRRQAAEELETILKAQPGDLRAATLLADCYLQRGDNDKAIALTAPIARAHPEDLDVAWVLGSALIASDKHTEGLALVEQVATGRNSAEAHALAGKTWLKVGDPEKGLKHLEEAARLDPDLPGIYTLRGIAREAASNNAGAEADLRKAIELNPKDLEALAHLGAILYSRRDLDAAKTYLDRALKVDPSNLFAHYEMALWKSASGKLAEAAKDLENVAGHDPRWIQPHIQLAALYYRLNRPEDGLKERQIVDRLSAEQHDTEAKAIGR